MKDNIKMHGANVKKENAVLFLQGVFCYLDNLLALMLMYY
jgi:hypothetical protein